VHLVGFAIYIYIYIYYNAQSYKHQICNGLFGISALKIEATTVLENICTPVRRSGLTEEATMGI